MRNWIRRRFHPFVFFYVWGVPWILLAGYFNIGLVAFTCACIGVFGSVPLTIYIFWDDPRWEF